jgi:hypothetical protein
MENNKIEVTFTHPRNQTSFTAFLSPQCTGQAAIQGLLAGNRNGPFLEPTSPERPYELAIKRTQQAITPNTTFEEAGVVNNDVIEVRQRGTGAGV